MRSIVEVTTPAAETDLTTLARVKLELSITNTSSDSILELKIAEASSDIEAALGYRVPRESCQRTFWLEAFESPPEYLLLDRSPVAEVESVTVDGVELAETRFRLDPQTGALHALDESGYPSVWCFCKSIVVEYDRGYIVPSESNSDLPAGIQGACVDLIQCYWFWKGRDPSLKAESAPGVASFEYWVGSIGESGELPPNVMARLAPYRRAPQA